MRVSHLAGRSSSLPKSIHVIAVPALENKTTSYRIEQRLTTATVHEFLLKTSYPMVPRSGERRRGAAGQGAEFGSGAACCLIRRRARDDDVGNPEVARSRSTERETGKILYHADNLFSATSTKSPRT